MKRYAVSAPDEFGVSERIEIAPDARSAKAQASTFWFEAGQKRHLSPHDRLHFQARLSCVRCGIFRCCDTEWDGPGNQLISMCVRCGEPNLATDAAVEEVIDALTADFADTLNVLGVFDLVGRFREYELDLLVNQDRWVLLKHLEILRVLLPLLRAAELPQIVRLHAAKDVGARMFAIRLHGSLGEKS